MWLLVSDIMAKTEGLGHGKRIHSLLNLEILTLVANGANQISNDVGYRRCNTGSIRCCEHSK